MPEPVKYGLPYLPKLNGGSGFSAVERRKSASIALEASLSLRNFSLFPLSSSAWSDNL